MSPTVVYYTRVQRPGTLGYPIPGCLLPWARAAPHVLRRPPTPVAEIDPLARH